MTNESTTAGNAYEKKKYLNVQEKSEGDNAQLLHHHSGVTDLEKREPKK